jgi:hypothetical protein
MKYFRGSLKRRPMPRKPGLSNAPIKQVCCRSSGGLLAKLVWGRHHGVRFISLCGQTGLRRIALAADAMITGGVNRASSHFTRWAAAAVSARLTPKATDWLARARMFILKRLEDALEAGDHVYSVIRGIGLSNDTGGSLLAPDTEGQVRAMRQAYDESGWTPNMVDIIECHGTGTPVGDAVEFNSLRTVWNSGWNKGSARSDR